MESTVTIKGQMTVPKAIRDYLHLKPGDKVKFFMNPNGTVVLLPKLPAAALRGMFKTRKHATVQEMNEAIAAGAVAGHRRGKGK